MLFLDAATLTALGTFTPAAIALLVPIGMSFAFTYRISPLMIGMMVICGALVHGIVAKSGLTISHAALFFASLGFNHLLAAGTYVLLRRLGEESFVEQPDDVTTGGSVPAPTGGGVGTAVKQQTVTVT